ncbi:MAG TPA: glycosyltransferase family 2 protein [Rugosimonospora sp.]|nr:glycosyltransferase family 2 protein [Rugosimonospora sp.]
MTAPAAAPPRVTAVVLAYGAERWLEPAVRAALDSTGADVDVVVVDNGCTTDQVDAVKNLPGVTVLRPAANLGFTGGCNLGAAHATGDWLAFVNSDAVVAPEALARLAAVAAEPGVGLAMGSVRLAGDPETVNTAGNPLTYFGVSWAGGCYEPASRYATRRSVTCGSGCCFVIGADTFRELGGFAEEYFAYHEDSELSLRLWQRGRSVEYVPDAVVVHHYEFSRNDTKSYLLERNRLVLLLTSYQARSLLLVAPMLAVAEVAMLGSAAAGGWLRAKLRGYAWLWRHRSWVRARRRQLQRERTRSDRDLAPLYTATFDATNVETPPGVGVFNALSRTWWALVRPLLPRRVATR